jgi:hypothetical protein
MIMSAYSMIPSDARGISYSPAPHATRWHRSVLQPLTYLMNVAVAAWTYPSWRTARVQWMPDIGALHSLLRDRPGPVICYGWHEYELLTFCAFKGWPAELMPTGIGHDGFLSRALHRPSTWFGFPVWVYRRESPVRPKQQLIDFLMATPQIIGLIADAGGPDRRIKPAMVEVARATNALLVPMTVAAQRVVTVRWPKRYSLPLPFATLVAHYGEPIAGGAATVMECQAALNRLEQRGRSSRGPKNPS